MSLHMPETMGPLAGAIENAALVIESMDTVAATVCATVSVNLNVSAVARSDDFTTPVIGAEVFEVGVDGSKPEAPLTVGPAAKPLRDQAFPQRAVIRFSLRIGTPFLWSAQAQPRYSLVISARYVNQPPQGAEIHFGFDASGNMVIVRNLTPCPPTESRSIASNRVTIFLAGDSTGYSNGVNQREIGRAHV